MIEKLQLLLDRPIAFQRVFLTLTRNPGAAIMLSQALYWSDRTKDDDGWFYKSSIEWEAETALTERNQRTIRKHLKQYDFWEEEKKRTPAGAPTIHYRLNKEKLFSAIMALGSDSSPVDETVSSPVDESDSALGDESYTESTTETTTTETTKEQSTLSADADDTWQQQVGALCWVCYEHQDVGKLLDKEKGSLLSEAKKIFKEDDYTIDELKEWYVHQWKEKDWRGQKGQRPNPSQVRSSIPSMRAVSLEENTDDPPHYYRESKARLRSYGNVPDGYSASYT